MDTVSTGKTLSVANIQTKLTREQKEAVGILSIGTFLEYFDLMLYVHMAVLLNELFFPKTDPFTASLLSAFAFCTTFVFRPIGALIFGYIGDNYGRKTTVIITTMIMATSCIVMANLPTYAQIGIGASWVMLLCRMMQGMSSMGEIVGVFLYFTESTNPPKQYVLVNMVAFIAALGGFVALAMITFITSFGIDWRVAFWLGAGVALVGVVARTALRETPEFTDARNLVNSALMECNSDKNIKDNILYKEKINIKTVLALFFMECGMPLCFYIAFVYCGNVLRDSFSFTAEQILRQSLMVSFVELLGCIALMYLCRVLFPLFIVKVRLIIFFIFSIFLPFILSNASSSVDILLIQSFIIFFALSPAPALSICYKRFPVLKRFTSAGIIYSMSRAVMYVICSFGIVFLTDKFGNFGLTILLIPVILASMYGVIHFEGLEKDNKNHLSAYQPNLNNPA